MNKQIYLKLARHLDRLPDGFPPSRTGAHLRLLAKLFNKEEAALAVHLTLERESAGAIADRAGLDVLTVAQMLESMAQKGLIFSTRQAGGTIAYQAATLVVGIWEFQVKNLDVDLLSAFAEYWSTVEDREQPETIPQMRTIPVRQSIQPHLEALTYEQVDELVKEETRLAVAPCICRREARLRDGGCSAPEESCLIFGDWADNYVRTGRGRTIERAVLARADAANLVLQPSNSREAVFICCCCGCCCGVLGGLKRHPSPADVVASAFTAALDPDACEGCWTCLERCQMEALSADGGRVRLHAERCIGCGLCVTTCPSGALTLQRKPEDPRTRPPRTLDETWRIIVGEDRTGRS